MNSNQLGRLLPASAVRIIAALFLLHGAMAGLAAEVVVNGSFGAGLTGWRLHPALANWNPLSEGGVTLHPPAWDYSGAVLYQNLNVTVGGGSQVVLSVRLKKVSAISGRAIAFDLDYLTTSGQTQRVRLLSPDNDAVADWAAYSATLTLPVDAAKLARLVSSKVGSGDFLMDDVSLSVVGTVGSLPQITSAGPLSGPLGSGTLLTIRGANFGSTAGQVIIGAWPGGTIGSFFGATPAQIDSWSSTQIVTRVVEPIRSGGVYVLAGGVEANGDVDFTVTSPNFTVDPVESEITVVRGATAELLLRVNFLNGFTSANGVSFFVMDPPGLGSTTDLPLKNSGGFRFTLNTATLPAGVHRGTAQSLEDTSYARFVPFTLKVITVTNINVFEYDTTFQKVNLTGKTVTTQGEVQIYFEATDNLGNLIGAGGFGPPAPSPITVTSSDSSRLLVFEGNFGPRFFALQSGSVTLTFTSPDGFSRAFPVTINLPATPYVDTAMHSALMAENSGLVTNTFSLHATEPLGFIGYEGFLSISFDTLMRDNANNAAYWPFQIPEGAQPGKYPFYGAAGTAKRFSLLTIVNAATRGQITGTLKIADDGGQAGPPDIFGVLECYDAAQSLVSSNRVETFNSSTYLAAYIPPGAHRIRFVPTSNGYPPVWHPNTDSFAKAAPVTVTAGSTVSNINFYFMRTNEPPANFTVEQPLLNVGRVELRCQTLRGVTYHLEGIASLTDTMWTTLQSLSGDGSSRVLADPAPPASGRFYRVRMTTP